MDLILYALSFMLFIQATSLGNPSKTNNCLTQTDDNYCILKHLHRLNKKSTLLLTYRCTVFLRLPST